MLHSPKDDGTPAEMSSEATRNILIDAQVSIIETVLARLAEKMEEEKATVIQEIQDTDIRKVLMEILNPPKEAITEVALSKSQDASKQNEVSQPLKPALISDLDHLVLTTTLEEIHFSTESLNYLQTYKIKTLADLRKHVIDIVRGQPSNITENFLYLHTDLSSHGIPLFDEQMIAECPIRSLGLSVRVLKACSRSGAFKLGELLRTSTSHINETHNFGQVSQEELRTKLVRFGWVLPE